MHDSSVRIVEGRDVPSHPSSSEAPPAPIRPPSPVLLRHCYCPLRIHTSYMTPMRRGACARARVPAPPVSTNRSEGMSLQRGLQPPVRSNTPIKFAHYKYNVPVCPGSPRCLFTGVGWGGVREIVVRSSSRFALMSLSLPDDSRCKRVAAIRWLAVFKRTTLGLTRPGRSPNTCTSQPRARSAGCRPSRRPATSSRQREEFKAARGHLARMRSSIS